MIGKGAGFVADLQAKTPLAGRGPVTVAGVILSEIAPGPMTSIAPYKGKVVALSEALQRAHGMAWPMTGKMTGQMTGPEGTWALWFARDMALLIGPVPDPALAAHAALTDQSDAWAVLRLAGPGARDVLARLCPLDLRPRVFKRGQVVRTILAHRTAAILCMEEDVFWIMVFRSMATGLVHEIETALLRFAARHVSC